MVTLLRGHLTSMVTPSHGHLVLMGTFSSQTPPFATSNPASLTTFHPVALQAGPAHLTVCQGANDALPG